MILLVIGVLVLIYLAFKFIKKVILLVLSIVIIIVLMFASVFGLVYYDFKQLSEQKDISINLVYTKSDEAQFGVSILMKEGNVDKESLSSISKTDLKSFEKKVPDSDSGTYVVYMSDSMFDSLVEGEVFSVSDFLSDKTYSKYNLDLTGKDVKKIIDSKDSTNTLVKTLFKKNNMTSAEAQLIEPIIKEQITSSLEKQNLGLKEALFLLVIQKSVTDQNKVLDLVEGYKDETITIEPERLTFSLIKWLPSGIIQSFLEKIV